MPPAPWRRLDGYVEARRHRCTTGGLTPEQVAAFDALADAHWDDHQARCEEILRERYGAHVAEQVRVEQAIGRFVRVSGPAGTVYARRDHDVDRDVAVLRWYKRLSTDSGIGRAVTRTTSRRALHAILGR